MKKTAMQEAIEKVESAIIINDKAVWECLKSHFLAKERQQIIEAYNAGIGDISEITTADLKHGLKYFCSRYGN